MVQMALQNLEDLVSQVVHWGLGVLVGQEALVGQVVQEDLDQRKVLGAQVSLVAQMALGDQRVQVGHKGRVDLVVPLDHFPQEDQVDPMGRVVQVDLVGQVDPQSPLVLDNLVHQAGLVDLVVLVVLVAQEALEDLVARALLVALVSQVDQAALVA